MAGSVRKIVSRALLFLIASAAAAVIVAALPSTAHALVAYDVYVGGKQVTSANANNVLGDGSVTYTASDNTSGVLTLNNARIKVGKTASYHDAGIYVGSSMKSVDIELNGSNSITFPASYVPSSSGSVAGILDYSTGSSPENVQVVGLGSGSLAINMGSKSFDNMVIGIDTDRGLVCYDCSVSMTLGSALSVIGVQTQFADDFDLIRSSMKVHITSSGSGAHAVSAGGDVNLYGASFFATVDPSLQAFDDASGITTSGMLRADHGSDVYVQAAKCDTIFDGSAGIVGNGVFVTDGSAVHAFGGQGSPSYGVRGRLNATAMINVEEGSLLEACGYTSSVANSGDEAASFSSSTLALGASVSTSPSNTYVSPWNKSSDLRTYKYVCIPCCPRLVYCAGVEGSASWQAWKYNGEMAGTANESRRMEGLRMQIYNLPFYGGIQYRAQVQSEGWQKWKTGDSSDDIAGHAPAVKGGKRLESIEIKLTDDLARHYDVWYHMQVQRFGWMGWAKSGQPAGTVGYSFRVEAIEAVLLPKGSLAPTTGSKVATAEANMLSFVRTNSLDNGKWQGPKGEGDVSGTRGQKKTQVKFGLVASSLPKQHTPSGGSHIQYQVYQGGKWSSWAKDDAACGSAKGTAIQGLKVKLSGSIASAYDVYYRVEVKNGSSAYWLGWAKNGAAAGWKGKNLEQIQIALVAKGGPKPTAANNAKQRWVLQRYPSKTSAAAKSLTSTASQA